MEGALIGISLADELLQSQVVMMTVMTVMMMMMMMMIMMMMMMMIVGTRRSNMSRNEEAKQSPDVLYCTGKSILVRTGSIWGSVHPPA